jgi:hypothetical protein
MSVNRSDHTQNWAFTNGTCATKEVNGPYTLTPLPALPDVSVVLSETYPVKSKGATSTVTSLGSASGVSLAGKGVNLVLEASELSSLGIFTATFSAVEEPANKEKCKTGTETAGTVVSKGEYHVVPRPTAGVAGILFLVSAFEVICGSAKVKIRGDVLSSLNAGSEASELSSFGGVLEGSLGVQKLSEYINDTGSVVKASLENDAGLEYVKADESVTGEVPLKVLGSQMIVIIAR